MNKSQQGLFDKAPEPWELDAEGDRLVARVVFAEAPFGPYDYLIPEELRDAVALGQRLKVPLGRGNRTMVGYCIAVATLEELGTAAGTPRKLKAIRSLIDRVPLIDSKMLQLAQWIASYYMAPLGQTIETVVPAGVRSNAGTRQTLFLSVPNQVIAKLTQIKLPKKQAEVLRRLASSPTPLTAAQLAQQCQCTSSPINELRKKGLLHEDVRRVQQGSHEIPVEIEEEGFALNPEQKTGLDAIVEQLNSQQHQTIVVHGITGSGKTEVYIKAIQRVIEFRRQAIVLVPEISLTPQTRQRFRARFDRVAVLHSHLSDSERHWHWQQIAEGRIDVVVGARSAIFAPVPNLGLVILDEEHDASFKQDKAPRYHARDVARERCKMLGIPLVLGSATPALDTWKRAIDKRSRLVSMPNRVLDLPLPDVAVVDLRSEFGQRGSRGAISRPLHAAMHLALKEDGQIILLLNRRGFATSIQCPQCGFVVECPNCDIALTHHRQDEKAICHYCDYGIPAPTRCPDCRFEGIRFSGFGTQKLEAEVRSRFPDVACLRMDSDTMQSHGSHEAALARFRSGEIRILLGTQMIAKGLDFPNVTLVGVINADTALHFPDFRAAERTFGLVTQVAGRTGRGKKGGRVMVQTFSPEHPAIQAAARHDFTMFASTELPIREEFEYPPYSRMARLVIRGESEQRTNQFAESLIDLIRQQGEQDGVELRLLGPAPAPIAKLRGRYRFHALLQSGLDVSLQTLIATATSDLKPPDDVQWIVDIDPLDML